MKNFAKMLPPILLLFIASRPIPTRAISSCNGPCQTLNDCEGELICVGGKCSDDPDLRTQTCSSSQPSSPFPSSSDECQPSGSLTCNGSNYPRYYCSPTVSSSTSATLTNNDFSEGGDGGAPSECDGQYHDNNEKIVALSTGWYNGGSRCGKMIKITSTRTGINVDAKVVDECDSKAGCDSEHAGQPPCRNNIVDASNGVWNALGLDISVGEEDVTWSMD